METFLFFNILKWNIFPFADVRNRFPGRENGEQNVEEILTSDGI